MRVAAGNTRQASLRRGRTSVAGQIYHVTATTQQRRPFFASFDAACAAARSFEHAPLLPDTRLLAWVLMPDHAHWLLQLAQGDDLSNVVQRLKSSSARSANAALGRSGPLWSRAFHDRGLRRVEDVRAVSRYIVSNPVRSGLATHVSAYPFWNAVWF